MSSAMSWVSVLWVAVAVEVVVVAAVCLVWYYRTRRAYTASLQSLLLAPHGYGQGFKQGMVHAVQYHSQRSKLVQYGIMAVSWSCLISCIWVWKIGLALFLANIVGLFWFWYPAMAKAEIERVRAGGGDPVEEKNAKISHIHHEHHRGPWAPPPPPPPPPSPPPAAVCRSAGVHQRTIGLKTGTPINISLAANFCAKMLASSLP